jgi:hypothetical protein
MASLAACGGTATPAQLIAALSVSQPTLSRLVRLTMPRVLALGRGKATRYGLLRELPGVGSRLPVYGVNRAGKVVRYAELLRLYGGKTVFRGADGSEAIYDDLPWFIDDMRPQGFLGRVFARSLAALRVPDDPRQWSADDTLLALSQHGEDCIGNLILGDASLARYLERATQAALPVARDQYPALAMATLQGEMPGSSAGGEQPKFTCAGRAEDGQISHVLVKFSPPLAEGTVARRWGDLLVCEHLALETLRAADLPAARSSLLEIGGRIMLEVQRFDRTARGRIGIVSAAAIEAQFVGGAGTWMQLGTTLAAQGRLAQADAARLATMELFGAMIGNSDMHLGNVSFFTDERFALAPTYDMLPMRLAPAGRGEVLRYWSAPAMPGFTHDNRSHWLRAASLAERFWRSVTNEGRLGKRVDPAADSFLEAISLARQRCELLVP